MILMPIFRWACKPTNITGEHHPVSHDQIGKDLFIYVGMTIVIMHVYIVEKQRSITMWDSPNNSMNHPQVMTNFMGVIEEKLPIW